MSRLTYQLNKIIDLQEAKRKVAMWQFKGETVVFTNGCFDILHRGHVTYLAQAAAEGTKLVVGLNTDNSVRRQGKGDDRPVNSEESRAIVLASLAVVDLVVLFDQDTPEELIKELLPDVLAKGADYDPDETDPTSKKYIVGSDVVLANGGKTIAIPLVDGYSTTNLIKKLNKGS
jgi:rfaE bifunctional protein nucleotidyltransferase chain/domain